MKTKLLLFLVLIVSAMANLKANNKGNEDLYFLRGSEWTYLDTGSNSTEEWTKIDFDDSSWKKGHGYFGFGYGNENTLLEKGHSRYYFRKSITINNVDELPKLIYLDVLQEHNVVLYINGIEIFRNNHFSNAKSLEKNKRTNKNVSQLSWYYYLIPNSHFVNGDNIITIEILNDNQESSKLSFDCFFSKIPLHKDGPYVFYTEDKVEIVKVTNEGIETEYHSLADDIILTVEDPTSNTTFSFPLKKEHNIPKAIYALPTKLFVTSDIEGQFGAYKKMLIDAKVMNDNFEWIYGDGHVVLSGDMVDRGQYVTEVLWLTYKLEQEAEKHGGKLQFVLGNHEIMVINNDVRYIHEKYRENAIHLQRTYSELFSKQSEFGRWMRKKNIIEKVGDYTFLHGGVSPEVASLGISYEKMNNYGRNRLNQESCKGECRIVTGGSKLGLYWYRGMGKQEITQEEVNEITKKINTDKIIIGHTKYREITPIYQEKVIAIDINHERNFRGSKVEALIYEDNCFKRFVSDDKGINKTNLLTDCEKLSLSELNNTEIKIYPNPTKDWIHINLNNNYTIELYDLNGKKINVVIQSKLTSTSINTSNLAKGIYVLKISNHQTNKVYQKKIIKE